ncbi:MAG: gamma-glutamyltransferase [Candidatus Sedimenticola sp. (ex Thyasira tokunagai)]
MPRYLLVALLLLTLSGNLLATPNSTAVASAHPLATRAGLQVLQQGGNAFDAAVAVSAALAVVEPYSSGIGGGGFWLLHLAHGNNDIMVDGRERAPLTAHRDMYLDSEEAIVPRLSMDGALAAGIPGEPAALVHIANKYGKLPLATLLAPAIKLAREGFPVTAHYQRMAGFRLKALKASKSSNTIFLDQGEIPEIGYLIDQPDLAATLEAMAIHGHDGFYKGEVAAKLIRGVTEAGGIWSQKDFDEYRIVEREPIRGSYLGYEVISAAPPSSGGIALVTMLNMLEHYNLDSLDEATRNHLLIEVMRRAYRDRAEYLGDSDFVEVPVDRLIHPYYAEGLTQSIRLDRATKSSELPGFAVNDGGSDTTHLSIIDSEGNYVSATLSINYPFGSGFTPEGSGVLLNDEMDDFSSKPGLPNAYGLVGAEANAIAPGKRMLSSMSPTFVRSDDRIAIIGTPGGSRIITMVLLGVLEFIEGKDPDAWVSRPRIHHQYLPPKVFVEPDVLSEATERELTTLGHTLEHSKRTWGNMQAVLWDRESNEVKAASDPRGEGESVFWVPVIPLTVK